MLRGWVPGGTYVRLTHIHWRNAVEPDTQIRLNMLKQAEALLFKYLDTCERLHLFDDADLKAWQAMIKDESSTFDQRLSLSREQKIERLRCEKLFEIMTGR